MLVANGVAAATGGGLAFIGHRVGHALVNEVLNFVPFGPFLKGGLAFTITTGIGWAFVDICERIARNEESQFPGSAQRG